jgi:CheY-like chemotaxis protein
MGAMVRKMLFPGTVLVVEFDPMARELLENVLRTGGFAVSSTPTGASALLFLSQQRGQIDWLVSRVALPGLVDGWILADEYHQHQASRPVILLSDPISEAACPSVDALFVSRTAPMSVLETLKSLITAQPAPMNSIMMSRAA